MPVTRTDGQPNLLYVVNDVEKGFGASERAFRRVLQDLIERVNVVLPAARLLGVAS